MSPSNDTKLTSSGPINKVAERSAHAVRKALEVNPYAINPDDLQMFAEHPDANHILFQRLLESVEEVNQIIRRRVTLTKPGNLRFLERRLHKNGWETDFDSEALADPYIFGETKHGKSLVISLARPTEKNRGLMQNLKSTDMCSMTAFHIEHPEVVGKGLTSFVEWTSTKGVFRDGTTATWVAQFTDTQSGFKGLVTVSPSSYHDKIRNSWYEGCEYRR